jgi:hypothetical protein
VSLVPFFFRMAISGVCVCACFPIPAFSEAMVKEGGYVSLALMNPVSGFGLNYDSKEPDGSARIRFRDAPDARNESVSPWLSFGFRATERIWLGGDYLRSEGVSDGRIGKRVHFLFFVNADTVDRYQFDMGRAWVGYQALENESVNLKLIGGLTVIQADAEATAEGLGHESARGVLAMPMLGFSLRKSGPYLTQWSLAADYSQIDVNNIHGRAANYSAAVEKPLLESLFVGLGYKHHELIVRVHRPTYDGQLIHKLSGPFVVVRQVVCGCELLCGKTEGCLANQASPEDGRTSMHPDLCADYAGLCSGACDGFDEKAVQGEAHTFTSRVLLDWIRGNCSA